MPQKLAEPTYTVEYRIRAVNKNGQIFVPNAFQSDVHKAVEIYNNYKNGFEAKSSGAKVTLEKRYIRVRVEDYTAIAEKMIEGVIES